MADDAGLTVREALTRYFERNGLPPDGGYDARWVRAPIGPVPFAFPNTAGRRRVGPAHDVHHVLTGYATDLTGEGEIAAWEIGAGVRDRSALALSLRVLGFALAFAPRRLLRAFERGRRSRHLLERDCRAEALLAQEVGSLREEIGLAGAAGPAQAADRRAFAGWALLAALIVWGPLLPLAALLVWWLG
jgi:hypothetical protein